MEKILFLSKGKDDIVSGDGIDEHIAVLPVYRYSNNGGKYLAQFFAKRNIPICEALLGDWAMNLNRYDVIVCEGLKGRKWVFDYIVKNKRKDCRLIMWHWNKIYKNEIDPVTVDRREIEQWSFDPDDCAHYFMKFNTQYFGNRKYDVNICNNGFAYFLGVEKGRGGILNQLATIFDSINYDYKLVVIKGSSDVSQESSFNGEYSYFITYQDNIENIAQSEIVLDIPQLSQRGLTLRVLEALYYDKKMITTNKEIVDLLFYNESNIYVLETDSNGMIALESMGTIRDDILGFIKKPYVYFEEQEKAKIYYSFEEWIKRFK